MKNSSRFEPTIDRNLTRSSSGCDGSVACARTRSLNSSQLSSRLMYSAGFLRSAGSIAVSAARGGSTRSTARERVVRARRSVRWRRSATAVSLGSIRQRVGGETRPRIIPNGCDKEELRVGLAITPKLCRRDAITIFSMQTVRPARLKPTASADSPLSVDTSYSATARRQEVIRGKALIFWDPNLPGTKFGRKLDAIDPDQITPAADCVSESLETPDRRWKAGSFRYLMPDFRAR